MYFGALKPFIFSQRPKDEPNHLLSQHGKACGMKSPHSPKKDLNVERLPSYAVVFDVMQWKEVHVMQSNKTTRHGT